MAKGADLSSYRPDSDIYHSAYMSAPETGPDSCDVVFDFEHLLVQDKIAGVRLQIKL